MVKNNFEFNLEEYQDMENSIVNPIFENTIFEISFEYKPRKKIRTLRKLAPSNAKRIKKLAPVKCIAQFAKRCSGDIKCEICLEDKKFGVKTKCCDSSFCRKCISNWLGHYKNSCPVCKTRCKPKINPEK